MFREEKNLAKNNEMVDNNSQETSKDAAQMFKVFRTYVNGTNEQNNNTHTRSSYDGATRFRLRYELLFIG